MTRLTVLTTFLARRRWLLAVAALSLGSLALRLWRLDSVPPGWRDDELIETLVISRNILDGDWAFYYPDASGHEPLYHVLNAGMLALFGPGVPGIRWLSAILGMLTVPLTYGLGCRLVGERPFTYQSSGSRRIAPFIAAAALSVSFWSLMYSRVGIRHISLPIFSLAAFMFFWHGLRRETLARAWPAYALAGVALGLGFYTYFASRGVPLILVAFGAYLWLADRRLLRRHWPGFALTLGVAAALALPLVLTLRQQPEAEARVAELALPLIAARQGDWTPLGEYVVETLGMFHRTGDAEWLYNIAGRPLFGPVGAAFFWGGVALVAGLAIRPLWPGRRRVQAAEHPWPALAAAFLLLWWLAGIAPGFLSVPPASLSHTILAQSAVYLLAAAPLAAIAAWIGRRPGPAGWRSVLVWLPSLLLLASVAVRDLPDYYVEWPARGNVRFLYRADLGDVARYLAERPSLTDFAVASLLAGPWDKEALALELRDAGVAGVRPRWYHPERALFVAPELAFAGYPRVPQAYAESLAPLPDGEAGGYTLSRTTRSLPVETPVCFGNGLCWETAVYHPDRRMLELGWRVERPLDLPPQPLISNPPPPGVDTRPRLVVFAHLLDASGTLLAADDGLWVDAATLQTGDRFVQQHHFPADHAAAAIAFGLYDAQTGQRWLTADRRDQLTIPLPTP